ncbi:hypothetical protein BDV36DRAFT_278668 [Aspergillus pseudocaelatus]|uniref:Uncharacterized protein n=1 Tax=Aspergillus pseudocaelatus TaxID=1825620 RepID=A0ABQ6VZ29_9EURO|nr:hypothetical protein BDV36DRAFT_278668 [Aspergillus pseudocaelatus]
MPYGVHMVSWRSGRLIFQAMKRRSSCVLKRGELSFFFFSLDDDDLPTSPVLEGHFPMFQTYQTTVRFTNESAYYRRQLPIAHKRKGNKRTPSHTRYLRSICSGLSIDCRISAQSKVQDIKSKKYNVHSIISPDTTFDILWVSTAACTHVRIPTGHDGDPSNSKMMKILRAPAARFSFNFHMGTMHETNPMLVYVLENGWGSLS